MKKTFLGLFLATLLFSFFAGAQRKPFHPTMEFAPTPYNNAGVVQVTNPENYTRVVAISDVHGMWHNLYTLLLSTHLIDSNMRWLGGKTLLIVVGDSIDKGPDSIYVMDFWMNLIPQARAAGGDVIHTLGNHEAEFLADPTNPKASVFLAELKAKGIPVEQVVSPIYPRGAFLRSMPAAARVGKYLFVHAGLYPNVPFDAFVTETKDLLSADQYKNPFFIGDNSFLEAKDWWKSTTTRLALETTLTANGMYGVVFGHQPDALGVTNDVAAVDMEKIIKIDSGMAPEAGANPGHMLIFMQPAQLNQAGPPEAISMTDGGVSHPVR